MEAEDPFLHIYLDPELTLIHLSWVREVNILEFESGFRYAIKLVEENQFKLWVNDFSLIDIPDTTILYNDLLPALVESGFKKGTAIVPRDSSYLLRFHQLKSHIFDRYGATHDFKMEVFSNLDLAFMWLGISGLPHYTQQIIL
ncbi:hypothetical protein [Adhaeribacter aquaticus]|uniref:hypothetical protein n=1 Tax=Adhaeribacter aquaticus TaxID=299567 RepID=UPI000418D5C6|nr:hypothetical protein [Adhaeribacter aquaticus]